jgi:CO dehydrogenase maturation factor
MEKTKSVLAVSGKGGVGKTTLTTLMLKILTGKKQNSILAIDANPDSNLANLLGISTTKKTVGNVTDELRKSIEKGEIPPDVMKKDLLEYRIFEILEETPDFDLLVMGRSEGEGCYCMVNKLLADIIDTLSKNYDLTLMDEHAGLEHLSRRTDRDVDVIIIVTDPSSMGFQTARRIKELAKEVHIGFKKIYLIGNKFTSEMEQMLEDKAKKMGIEYAGNIPHDDDILNYNLAGKPLLELPSDSPALIAAKDILGRIGLLN